MSKWYVSEGHPDHGIISDDGRLIAMVTTDEDNPQEPEEVLHNAALLAAAPELLAALKRLLNYCNNHSDYDAIGEADRAIANAEGRGE